jgi:hypothetical protein
MELRCLVGESRKGKEAVEAQGQKAHRGARAWLRALLSVILIVAFAFPIGGCMNIKTMGMTEEEAVKFMMTEHLEKKYGPIEFEEAGFIEPELLDPNYTWNLYLKGGDWANDGFSVYMSGDKKEIVDSYYGLFVRDDYETLVKDVADEHFTDCKVFCSFSKRDFPNELTKDVPLDEAIAEGYFDQHSPYATVLVKNVYGNDGETFKADAEAFMEGWGEKNLGLKIRIFCITDTDFKKSGRAERLDFIWENASGFEEIGAAYDMEGERYR